MNEADTCRKHVVPTLQAANAEGRAVEHLRGLNAGAAPLGSFGADRAATFVPAIMALAVISTAFTGQAIAVAFDRRYGALKRLGATALPVWGIIAGKSLAVVAVVVVLAAFNRFRFLPRLLAGAPLPKMRIVLGVEAVLLAAVLLATGWLTTTAVPHGSDVSVDVVENARRLIEYLGR